MGQIRPHGLVFAQAFGEYFFDHSPPIRLLQCNENQDGGFSIHPRIWARVSRQ